LLNQKTETISGTGIPMATDIAFAIGILSLLGNRVPFSLKIFLTALAVIDDLLAIIVISVFYTEQIHYLYLSVALLCFLILLFCNRKKVENTFVYLIGGILMWFFMFHSGVHPTISGVLLAFSLPFGDGSEKYISHHWQKKLHYPIAFVILPLFALANTCIIFNSQWLNEINSALSIGIIAGLVVGKPLGITFFAMLSVYFGLCRLPSNIKFKHILGVGILGGIGFTMSIFITLLAFKNNHLIAAGKIAIILSSIISALLGSIFLFNVLPPKKSR
jgi:NhaA family Na+:H+ antiporter